MCITVAAICDLCVVTPTPGNIFHGIGISLISFSSLNQSAMEELKYSELCDKLRLSLEQQCFPQTMCTYSVKTERGVAVLLTEMDSRRRPSMKSTA
jgi:hypothetical protein